MASRRVRSRTARSLSPFAFLTTTLAGYHATTPETFAAALHTALTLSAGEDAALRQRARTWAVQRFSEEEFARGWNASGWRDWLRV